MLRRWEEEFGEGRADKEDDDHDVAGNSKADASDQARVQLNSWESIARPFPTELNRGLQSQQYCLNLRVRRTPH